ncbi:MAG TPA: nucleotide sugar dehydrogenase [Candidatus Acidoferrales bacterium]|nr:nucleotide sugar dehydrogenase [Candidatus Acidoferrales bacterium]
MTTELKIVIVGGCGHVGLPLGLIFATRGAAKVTLLDVAADKVEEVNRGRMPFLETGAEELLRMVIGKQLRATLDTTCLRTADVVIAVVGTPVDEHLNPTVTGLYENVDRLLAEIRDGSLLVLRSTIYPGVTKLVYDKIRARGRNIHLSFCPERIAEGKALEELVTLPQIVAAFDHEAQAKARELFARIAPKIVELPPLEAELAKLFTNSWRYLNFAVSNQFYMLAQSYGLDFYRIHNAIVQDYPRMRNFARAGFAAGPCLLKDTLQLATFASNNFFLGHAAMLINEGLPNFVVDQLRKENLSRRRIAILGMAFKGDSDDSRSSLSYKLKKLLQLEACEIFCSDPYVKDPTLVPAEVAIEQADIVILGAPHSVYRDLKIPADKIVLDVWGFWPAGKGLKAKPRELVNA